MDNIPDLYKALDDLLQQIPPGHVSTPGNLAAALGHRNASVWIGHHLLHHGHKPDCPCHRVVRHAGRLGGYVTGEIAGKIALLRSEGVEVREEFVDLSRFGFHDFETEFPLKRLAAAQAEMESQVQQRAWKSLPSLVAGVDVSYTTPRLAVAAYVLFQTRPWKLVWSTTSVARVDFPFISSFLSFRELPVLREVVNTARGGGQAAEIVLVDGSGALHPRGVGLASHLGVLERIPTIGLTKKLLCGSWQAENPPGTYPVVHQGQERGIAVCPTHHPKKAVFLSPGQGTDLRLVKRLAPLMWGEHRLPEPIYWADRLSREAARELDPASIPELD